MPRTIDLRHDRGKGVVIGVHAGDLEVLVVVGRIEKVRGLAGSDELASSTHTA